MTTSKTLPVSDLNQLAALQYSKIQPLTTEYSEGRFWAFYEPTLAQPILDQFESGSLQVDALSSRVKDKIFERERSQRRRPVL